MLENEYKRIVTFLNKEKFDYLVIGGIAFSVIGEPRETVDIDFCIFIKKTEVKRFLKKAEKNNYTVNKKVMIKRAESTGTFNIMDGNIRIDFIIASHQLEKSAFKRRQKIRIHGVEAYFPTPEDFILLKVVPGRKEDIVDAEKVAIRYKGKLDEKYLLDWAMKLSDEAEDMRIYKEVRRLLKL